MRKFKVIQLDRYGNFPSALKTILFIPAEQAVRFICLSPFLYDHKAFLLHSFRQFDLFPTTFPAQLSISHQHYYQGSIVNAGWVCDVPFTKSSGSFKFQLVFGRKEGDKLIVEKAGNQQWLVVQANLRLKGKEVSYKDLLCQSVMPRALGHGSRWVSILSSQVQIGYNSFHFPPILKLGFSKSYYAIANHTVPDPDYFQNFDELKKVIREVRQSGALCLTDIVLNHISFDCDNLHLLEQGLYSPSRRPQLNAVLLIQSIVYRLGKEYKPRFHQKASPQLIEEFVAAVKIEVCLTQYWRYFQLHKDTKQKMVNLVPPAQVSFNIFDEQKTDVRNFIRDNTKLGASKEGSLPDLKLWQSKKLKYQLDELNYQIVEFNREWEQKAKYWVEEIAVSLRGQLTYKWLSHPEYVCADHPLVKPAFSKLKLGGKTVFALNNGWVNRIDPLQNFATSQNQYYLRRQVYIWGDLLKLDFGASKQSCPALWQYMEKYVCLMAELFDGFRIDNLHGTPLHVAQHFMKKARKVNQSLLVFAELFTGSEQRDAIFVKRAGVDALVRQAKSINSSQRFTGEIRFFSESYQLGSLSKNYVKQQAKMTILDPKFPPKILYDQTHDNQPVVRDHLLPLCTAAAVLGIFSGSSLGVDQFFPCRVPVCGDNRLYPIRQTLKQTWVSNETYQVLFTYEGKPKDIVKIAGSWDQWKSAKALQFYQRPGVFACHIQLKAGKYQYKFKVNQKWECQEGRPTNPDGNHFIQVSKESKLKKYDNFERVREKLAAFRARRKDYNLSTVELVGTGWVKITKKLKDKSGYLMAVVCTQYEADTKPQKILLPGELKTVALFRQGDLANALVDSPQLFPVRNYTYFQQDYLHSHFDHKGRYLQPVLSEPLALLISCQNFEDQNKALVEIKQFVQRGMQFDALSPQQLNFLLFSTGNQERERGGHGYEIGGQEMPYCGLLGGYSVMKKAVLANDRGCSLFDNIRSGNWLLQHYINRLQKSQFSSTFKHNIKNLKLFLQLVKRISKDEIALYFCKFMKRVKAYYSFNLKSEAHPRCQRISKQLIMGAYAFIAKLPNSAEMPVTVAAGLPHFSTGWTRNWGRDTFISFKGILLLNRLFKLAREVILQYSNSYRFGLIPNLLDFGRNPRYNSRDAVWWYLKAILDYIEFSHDYSILQERVPARDRTECSTLALEEVVADIFQRHAAGIKFREPRAGIQIDSNMDEAGFNVQLFMDSETGFIRGGNSRNCLTWMDKMGSSEEAGNKGWPATSRNGSPVELVGLLYHCLTRFEQLRCEGKFNFGGVLVKGRTLSYKDWAALLKDNFEKWFFINKDESKWHFTVKPEYVQLRSIYKDNVLSQNRRTEHFLRPNFLIALVLAPDLFVKEHAIQALQMVETHLLRPNSLGVKTLAPSHVGVYCSYYDNQNRSANAMVAHGFSYHNGPEWVWLYGYYLMAVKLLRGKDVTALAAKHLKHISQDGWLSLPQLTNDNGQFCRFSCQAQAWSIATIQEALSS